MVVTSSHSSTAMTVTELGLPCGWQGGKRQSCLLYEVQKQLKLSDGVRIQDSGYTRVEGLVTKTGTRGPGSRWRSGFGFWSERRLHRCVQLWTLFEICAEYFSEYLLLIKISTKNIKILIFLYSTSSSESWVCMYFQRGRGRGKLCAYSLLIIFTYRPCIIETSAPFPHMCDFPYATCSVI